MGAERIRRPKKQGNTPTMGFLTRSRLVRSLPITGLRKVDEMRSVMGALGVIAAGAVVYLWLYGAYRASVDPALSEETRRWLSLMILFVPTCALVYWAVFLVHRPPFYASRSGRPSRHATAEEE